MQWQQRERCSLVPLDDCPLDLKVGQADARLPRLRRVEEQVVEGVPDLGLSHVAAIGE